MTSAGRALAPLLRRSVVASRSTTSALRGGGGGATPPLPPFARNLTPGEKVCFSIFISFQRNHSALQHQYQSLLHRSSAYPLCSIDCFV